MKTYESEAATLLYGMNLTWMADNLPDELAEAARKRRTCEEFLLRLLHGEDDARKARAVARRLAEAGLMNCIQTLSQYDFAHPARINEELVRHLFTLDFIRKDENIVFIGGVGVGKTHLAKALACEACRKGHSALCVSAMQMANMLVEAQAGKALEKTVAKLAKPRLLVIDELGYIPMDRAASELMFQVFSRRYDAQCAPVVITTNRTFKEWPKTFAQDGVLTSAVLDRILHRCNPVVIEGTSYRMRKITDLK